MTLFKQLSLLIAILLITIFAIVLGIDIKNSVKSVQDQLYADAKNTATSLSLSLASANGNISMISTMINADFDNGIYQSISLVGMQGDTLYERHGTQKVAEVPTWFTRLISIKAPVASANVSAGWNPIGVLNIQSDTKKAYQHLYEVIRSLTISFAIIFIISFGFLYLLLMLILKPLKALRAQADAITNSQFIIQEKVPFTQDFKDLVVAMNAMTKKVEGIFHHANETLQKQSELLYKDEGTGLHNKKFLVNKLPEYLKIDAQIPEGVSMLIALNGVTEANQVLGHAFVNKLFIEITTMLKRHANDFNDSLVVRMSGTEFFLLLPLCKEEDGLLLAKSMEQASSILLGKELDQDITYLSFGLYPYHHTQTADQLLSALEYALSQAKNRVNDENIYMHKTVSDAEIMSKNEWNQSLQFALQHNAIQFDTYNVVDFTSRKTAHKVLSISLISERQKFSYGQFIAAAIALGLDIEIYKKAVDKLLASPSRELRGSVCSLRLSNRYLDHPDTFNEIKSLLERHAKYLPFKLIIELPDSLLSSNSEHLRAYKTLFEKHDIKIGIFEFIGNATDYSYLKELRPAYIKAELNYFVGQSNLNVSSLQVVTDSIGIDLIATSVMNTEFLNDLKSRNVTIIQGPASEMI
jgi:predicted signal transduction protein with EAL and GGDEF domain